MKQRIYDVKAILKTDKFLPATYKCAIKFSNLQLYETGMGKTILLNLFKTFVLSIILSIAVSCIFYAVVRKGADYGHAVPLIVEGAFYLNCILLMMASPALFLSYPSIWGKPVIRLFLYFSGPLAFILTDLTFPLNSPDTMFYLITGVIFFIIHAVFFYRLLKKEPAG